MHCVLLPLFLDKKAEAVLSLGSGGKRVYKHCSVAFSQEGCEHLRKLHISYI